MNKLPLLLLLIIPACTHKAKPEVQDFKGSTMEFIIDTTYGVPRIYPVYRGKNVIDTSVKWYERDPNYRPGEVKHSKLPLADAPQPAKQRVGVKIITDTTKPQRFSMWTEITWFPTYSEFSIYCRYNDSTMRFWQMTHIGKTTTIEAGQADSLFLKSDTIIAAGRKYKLINN